MCSFTHGSHKHANNYRFGLLNKAFNILDIVKSFSYTQNSDELRMEQDYTSKKFKRKLRSGVKRYKHNRNIFVLVLPTT